MQKKHDSVPETKTTFRLPPARARDAKGCLPIRNRIRFNSVCRTLSSLSSACFRHATDMPPGCFGNAAGLSRACFRHALHMSAMRCTWFRHALHMLQACLRLASIVQVPSPVINHFLPTEWRNRVLWGENTAGVVTGVMAGVVADCCSGRIDVTMRLFAAEFVAGSSVTEPADLLSGKSGMLIR